MVWRGSRWFRTWNCEHISTLFGEENSSLLEAVYNLEESHLKSIDPDYGTKWIYMPDGNGVPQKALLMKTPSDIQFGQRASKGPPAWLHLYTRYNKDKSILLNPPQGDNAENGENSLFSFFKPQNIAEVFNSWTHGSAETESPEIGPESELNKALDPQKITKILIHGWRSGGDASGVVGLRDAYLKRNDYNIIVVDWSELAQSSYYSAVKSLEKVKKYVSQFLNNLLEYRGFKSDQIHIIGHSLGAHIAGMIGSQLKQQPYRITGLDPARPGFEYATFSSHNLNTSDAHFVDVIHTCSGVLGYNTALGNADFYPNGGKPSQPGCSLGQFGVCSHSRAYELYAESIENPRAFPAKGCKSLDEVNAKVCTGEENHMGENVNQNIQGLFYVETYDTPPFSLS